MGRGGLGGVVGVGGGSDICQAGDTAPAPPLPFPDQPPGAPFLAPSLSLSLPLWPRVPPRSGRILPVHYISILYFLSLVDSVCKCSCFSGSVLTHYVFILQSRRPLGRCALRLPAPSQCRLRLRRLRGLTVNRYGEIGACQFPAGLLPKYSFPTRISLLLCVSPYSSA